MSKLTETTILLLLTSTFVSATTKKCNDGDGTGNCKVTETLASGLQVEHIVRDGDVFETSPQRSYVWSNASEWEVVPT